MRAWNCRLICTHWQSHPDWKLRTFVGCLTCCYTRLFIRIKWNVTCSEGSFGLSVLLLLAVFDHLTLQHDTKDKIPTLDPAWSHWRHDDGFLWSRFHTASWSTKACRKWHELEFVCWQPMFSRCERLTSICSEFHMLQWGLGNFAVLCRGLKLQSLFDACQT